MYRFRLPLHVKIYTGHILAFILLAEIWIFGLYGALIRGTFLTLPIQLSIASYLLLANTALVYIVRRTTNTKLDFTFKAKDVFWGGLFCSIILLLGWSQLHSDVQGDAHYYGQWANEFPLLIVKLISRTPFLLGMPYRTLLQAISLLLLACAVAIYRLLFPTKNTSNTFMLSLFFIVLFSFRIMNFILDRDYGPHPSLFAFFAWISTAVFGYTNVGLRILQTFPLVCLFLFIYLLEKRTLGALKSGLLSLTICSAPLFILSAFRVESSIWSATIFSGTLFLTLLRDRLKLSDVHWFIVFTVISLGICVRIATFACLPFALFCFVSNILSTKNINQFTAANIWLYLFQLTPLLVCLPIILDSVINGTPATYTGFESSYIPNHHSTLSRVMYAFQNNIPLKTAISSAGIFVVVESLFIFLRHPCEKNYLANRILFLVFAATLIWIFFSIRPVLWGYDKYKVELLAPFSSIGIYILFSKLNNVFSRSSFSYLFLGIILCFNVSNYFSYPSKYPDYLVGTRYSRQTDVFPIPNYQYFLNKLNDQGVCRQSIQVIGTTYGGLSPYLLAGYSVNDVNISKRVYEELVPTNTLLPPLNTLEGIDQNPAINAVIVADIPTSIRNSYLDRLAAMGWLPLHIHEASFGDSDIFTRPDSRFVESCLSPRPY